MARCPVVSLNTEGDCIERQYSACVHSEQVLVCSLNKNTHTSLAGLLLGTGGVQRWRQQELGNNDKGWRVGISSWRQRSGRASDKQSTEADRIVTVLPINRCENGTKVRGQKANYSKQAMACFFKQKKKDKRLAAIPPPRKRNNTDWLVQYNLFLEERTCTFVTYALTHERAPLIRDAMHNRAAW